MITRRFRGDWARDQVELVRVLNDFDKRLRKLEQAITKQSRHRIILEDEPEPSTSQEISADEEE